MRRAFYSRLNDLTFLRRVEANQRSPLSLFQRPNVETQASLLVRHSTKIWLIPLFFMIYFVSI
jgi:hypothetical protein